MRRKRFAPEKIIRMLREAEVSLAQGLTVGKVCRRLEISEQTYYQLAKTVWWNENQPGQAPERT